VRIENELVNFTNYLYDLSSANFMEENVYFNENNLSEKCYTNRVMSRKIKDFKEIQDEFNTANYVYSKLDPHMFS
jgi:hypothetical protein